jgi:hypothetical protein
MIFERFRSDCVYRYLSLTYYASDWLIWYTKRISDWLMVPSMVVVMIVEVKSKHHYSVSIMILQIAQT